MTTEHSRQRIIGNSKRSKNVKKINKTKTSSLAKPLTSRQSIKKVTIESYKNNKLPNYFNWILVFSIAVLLIIVAWFFHQNLLPGNLPTLVEKEITATPTTFEQGEYYKYEIPREKWQSIQGTTVIQQLVNSGLRFDEAWFQTGGWVCKVCGSYAAPIFYFKNPDNFSGEEWQKIDKPGFYPNLNFVIYQYSLQ